MCSGSAKHEILCALVELCYDTKIKNGSKQSKTIRNVGEI
jgi:hypothetical protein